MRTKKQKLAKEAEDLWKQKCLEKYGDRCMICGKPANTFHHFIPRSRSILLKYDIENGIPICQKHHYILHFSNSPDDVYQIIKTIRDKRGKKWYNYIDKKRKDKSGGFYTIQWLEKCIQILKDRD